VSTRTFTVDNEGRPLAPAPGLPAGHEVVIRRTGEAPSGQSTRSATETQRRDAELRRLSAGAESLVAKAERAEAELRELSEKRAAAAPPVADVEDGRYDDELARVFPGFTPPGPQRRRELEEHQALEEELPGAFPWLSGDAA
jgi:hypothetical protein